MEKVISKRNPLGNKRIPLTLTARCHLFFSSCVAIDYLRTQETSKIMDIYSFLTEHHIEYERFDHPPVYTVEDVHRLALNLPGARIKNLFLCEKKGPRHFLVVVPDDKRVDMKALPKILESGHVSFGSPDRLKKHLGIEPGSVSLLAIVNDSDHAVEVVMDESLWRSEAFQCHPLINTSTLVIPRDSMMRFLRATGHEVKLADIEAQQKK